MVDRNKLLQAMQKIIEPNECFTLIVAKQNCKGYELEITSDMNPQFVSLLLATLSQMIDMSGEQNNGHAVTKH